MSQNKAADETIAMLRKALELDPAMALCIGFGSDKVGGLHLYIQGNEMEMCFVKEAINYNVMAKCFARPTSSERVVQPKPGSIHQ